MSNWQPIETAPKDGTHILLAGDGKVDIGFYVSDEGRVLISADVPYWQPFDHSYWEKFDSEGNGWFDPTHWQLLPEPPEPTP